MPASDETRACVPNAGRRRERTKQDPAKVLQVRRSSVAAQPAEYSQANGTKAERSCEERDRMVPKGYC